MIIDSFLFSHELELLELRLEYLYPKVDYFIITEFSQSFSGISKKFNYEDNIHKYKKYTNKVIYNKIDFGYNNFNQIIEYLDASKSIFSKSIKEQLLSHDYYPKDELNWISDAFQRECIKFGIEKILNYVSNSTILLLSDLDEIPKIEVLEDVKKYPDKYVGSNLLHSEFRYFANFYKNSKWNGKSILKIGDTLNISFNNLRRDNIFKTNFSTKYSDSGYHFTSFGGIHLIKNKIKYYGHQEFNTKVVLNYLDKNIYNNRDIFYRNFKNDLIKIDISSNKLYDNTMRKLLSNYTNFIYKDFNIENKESVLFYIIRLLKFKFSRLLNQIIKCLTSQ